MAAAELRVRPMRPDDVDLAASASAAAFGITIEDEHAAAGWRRRIGHGLETDPGGAFVAERDGRLIGLAEAIRRERLWCLSLLAIRPDVQGTGAGSALMEAALGYAAGTDSGLIASSNDPRALRLYARAGFALQPTFDAEGTLDRSALPPPSPDIRLGGDGDIEAVADLTRAVRGAPHTLELAFAIRQGYRMLLLDDRGFAVVRPGRVWLLAARDEQAARELLWSALALSPDDGTTSLRWITGEQRWAIEIVVAAGLRLSAQGALGVRGRPGPLWPYLPSAPFA